MFCAVFDHPVDTHSDSDECTYISTNVFSYPITKSIPVSDTIKNSNFFSFGKPNFILPNLDTKLGASFQST